MTIEQRLSSLEGRVSDLEARQPVPHNTPETNPFMGREPQSPPQKEPDAAFVRIFGNVRVNGEGRVLDRREEQTLNRRAKSFQGIALDAPQSDAVDALLDHYEISEGLQLKPEYIGYGGEVSLVFPDLPGLGYGTPDCYVLAVSLIEKDFGLERKIDRTVELIEQRRAKG